MHCYQSPDRNFDFNISNRYNKVTLYLLVTYLVQPMKSHNNGSYLPSKVLTSYAAEKILFEEFRDENRLQGEALKANKKYAAIKKHKSDVIDKIFESMANLIFFFDVLNRSPILEDDLVDIAMQVTGVIRNAESDDPYLRILLAYMLGNSDSPGLDVFIQARTQGRAYRVVPDYQVLMAEMMHFISLQAFIEVANAVLPAPQDAYEPAAPFISQDLERASAWVAALSRKARASVVETNDKARRISIPDLSDLLEKRRERFNEETRRI
jgi:hypothetical protein